MMNMFFIKKTYILLCLFIFSSCSINDNQNNIHNYFLEIKTSKAKYDTLLKFELQKYNQVSLKNNKNLILNANINFSSEETLSLSGLNPLYKMTGKIIYKILKDDKILHKGSLSSVVNYGNISSIYAQEENTKFIKERLVKNLSFKLINKIKIIMKREN